MNIEILQLIQNFLVAWVISSWALELTEFMSPTKEKNKWLRFLISLAQYILSCPKCLSFWLILVYTGNFYMAAAVAFLIYLQNKIIDNIKTRL